MALSDDEQTIARGRVLERFAQDNPKHGREFREWVARVSAELGIGQEKVRRYVAQEQEAYLLNLRIEGASEAQAVAQTLGAGLTEALSTIKSGLVATKRRPLLDSKGRPKKLHENKPLSPENMIYVETPAWESRLSAATALLKVLGGFAPEQVEIKRENVYTHLTDKELLARLDELNRNLSELRNPTAVAGSAGDSRRIDGAASAAGRLLLDDPLHEDAGRAGHREPVQALPAGSVHPPRDRQSEE